MSTNYSHASVNNCLAVLAGDNKQRPLDQLTLAYNWSQERLRDIWKEPKEEYKIKESDKTKVLIINNLFNNPQISSGNYKTKNRRAGIEDHFKLDNLFNQMLNFDTQIKQNVTSQELEIILTEFKTEIIAKDYHSCFIILMTHGVDIEGSRSNIIMDEEELIQVNLYDDIIYKFIYNQGVIQDKEKEMNFYKMPKVFLVETWDHDQKEVDILENLKLQDTPQWKLLPNTLVCHSKMVDNQFGHWRGFGASLMVDEIERLFCQYFDSLTLHEILLKVHKRVIKEGGSVEAPSMINKNFKSYRLKLNIYN